MATEVIRVRPKLMERKRVVPFPRPAQNRNLISRFY
jgi:hypothetical protein